MPPFDLFPQTPTQEIQLRIHQEKAVHQLRESLKAGYRAPLVAAACSFGKTILAAYLLQQTERKFKKGVFLADRVQLINQTAEKFQSYGMDPGVIQADHPLTNPRKNIQIASVQTLSRRNKLIETDYAIRDEAHVIYKIDKDIRDKYNNIPYIGLTATPYSKALGTIYDHLIIPITARELTEQGFLKPVRYYCPPGPSMTGVKTTNRYGRSDWSDKGAASVMDDPKIIGDIVETWHKYGSGRQTIGFAPTIDNSKHLAEEFRKTGVNAVSIDCYMPTEIKEEIIRSYGRGEIQILFCVSLLEVGFDDTATSCIIDACPTKSIIRYVQRYGRAQRIHEGIDDAIVLDHAGNWHRHGSVIDIQPQELCDGTKKEKDLIKPKEKKEAKESACPKCSCVSAAFICPSCGHKPEKSAELVTEAGELVEMNSVSIQVKQNFASELIEYGREKGKSENWWTGVYKEKFKEWPGNQIERTSPKPTSIETLGYIKHLNIKRSKSKYSKYKKAS